PNWGFTDLQKDKNGTGEQNNAPLRKLMMEVTAAIREMDKKHIVIIEGNGWGNNYNGVLPPWDNNMVLSFHKYWNFNDDASIKHIIDYRDKYNIPVWLGETGENSNVWFTDAIHLLEKNNIGWAWWPLKKLGNNNPLQVRNNPAYEQVQRYWRNDGPKPDAATAYKGLMELANATNIKANIVHHDVIDAMIRQPSTNQTKAFVANRLNKSLNIDATGYDFGRNGYAYFDTDTANYHVTTGKRTAGNRGNIYRNDGVDIQKAATADSYFVSDIEDGEWLQYTINVSAKGNYNLAVLASAEKDGGKVSVLNGDAMLVKDVTVPATGNTEKWQLLKIGKVYLNKGENKLRILATKGGFNLAQVQLSK
ncbi:MAG: glycosyl hydrolase family 5, partial [Sphingobacteriaceae bacterium]